ncbi:MAG: pentapeptide repeat-containing protein, partial [Zoogloeaceae bacterium]|nr:pentapeptide repeat-containing protein [Zoogloeaceae bacterium]
MQIEPNDFLYSASQPFVLQGAMRQSLTIGMGVDLATGRVLPAAQVLGAAMAAMASGDCLDMGLPKREAEWLLAGQAQTPGGQPATSLLVDVVVGKASRRFLVKDETGAFTSVPLVWQETFGAPENPENPLGCGLAPDPATGRTRAPRVVGAEDAWGHPACPGPMGAWPARMGNMGRYDSHWLKTRCPDLPDDCDFSFVNLAQAAQRLPGGLQGDETVTLKNLCHDAPDHTARLPGKTLHAFVLRQGMNEEEAYNVPYDTLWLFPNQRLALLLGHLLLAAVDGRASDILRVRLEIRPPVLADDVPPAAKAPPPPEVAPPPKDDLLSTLMPKTAAGVALAATGLAASVAAKDEPKAAQAAVEMAASSPSPSPDQPALAAQFANMRSKALKSLDESLGEINASMAQAGLSPLTPEQVEATRQEIIRQTTMMEEMTQKIEATPAPDLHDTLRKAGVSESMIAGVDAVLELPLPKAADYPDAASWNAAIARYQAEFERHLPLSDSVRKMQTTFLQLQGPGGEARMEEMAGPAPRLEEVLTRAGLPPEKATLFASEMENVPSFSSLEDMKTYMAGLEKRMAFAPGSMTSVVSNMQKVAARIGIELEPETPPAPEVAVLKAAQAPVPDKMATADETGRNVSLQDASDALSAASLAQKGAAAAPAAAEIPANLDFSGQDLAGRDFSGQLLEGAIFHDAKLAGANFSDAKLKNADFDRADCAGAVFDRATLDNASFSATTLTDASLRDASAESARFIDANLQAAKAAGLQAKGAEFDGAALALGHFAGADFTNAAFRRARADQVDVAQANFTDATLHDSDFSRANLTNANLSRALARGVRFVDADFSGADLSSVTLMSNSEATGGNFSGATLKDADWREVKANAAIFTGSQAEGGRFVACDFGACRWQAARASGADFSHTNLAGADFSRA